MTVETTEISGVVPGRVFAMRDGPDERRVVAREDDFDRWAEITDQMCGHACSGVRDVLAKHGLPVDENFIDILANDFSMTIQHFYSLPDEEAAV